MMAKQGFLEKVLNGLEDEIEMYLERYGEEHTSTKSLIEYHSRIAALNGDYPGDAEDLRGVDVKYKARIMKAELRSVFPDQKFSVRISRFTGGSSIHVSWEEIPMLAEDEEQYHVILDNYSSGNFVHGQGPGYQAPKTN